MDWPLTAGLVCVALPRRVVVSCRRALSPLPVRSVQSVAAAIRLFDASPSVALHLSAASRGQALRERFDSRAGPRTAITDGPHRWTVLAPIPGDTENHETSPLARLRRLLPSTPLIGVVLPGHSSPRGTLLAGGLGVDDVLDLPRSAGIASPFRGSASPPAPAASLKHTLLLALRALEASLVNRVAWTAIAQQLPYDASAHVQSVLTAALNLSHKPTSNAALASALGLSSRALRQRCRMHHDTSPNQLLAWTRGCVIATYADSTSLSLDDIAVRLSFSSTAALHRALDRAGFVREPELSWHARPTLAMLLSQTRGPWLRASPAIRLLH